MSLPPSSDPIPSSADRRLSRRRFIEAGIAAAALPAAAVHALGADAWASPRGSVDDIPIIDTHIHLFDPTRPQGVPWPDPHDKIRYHPALPERYRRLAAPLGVRGAIEVEASAWLEDNQWVLDLAAKDTIIVGTVGHLEAGRPGFARNLERFHANPLFRGIRYGNLWGRDLGTELRRPEFIADMKRLVDADLVLDTANPTPRLLDDVVRLSDRVPHLRIVIDHLPGLRRPAAGPDRDLYDASLREFAGRPQIYVKLSQILREFEGKVSRDLATYLPRLDEIYGVFGPDRVVYGSDWPNSDPYGTYAQVLAMARAFISSKGREAAEKYFWKNSVAAYRWVRRDAGQPAIDGVGGAGAG